MLLLWRSVVLSLPACFTLLLLMGQCPKMRVQNPGSEAAAEGESCEASRKGLPMECPSLEVSREGLEVAASALAW